MFLTIFSNKQKKAAALRGQRLSGSQNPEREAAGSCICLWALFGFKRLRLVSVTSQPRGWKTCGRPAGNDRHRAGVAAAQSLRSWVKAKSHPPSGPRTIDPSERKRENQRKLKRNLELCFWTEGKINLSHILGGLRKVRPRIWLQKPHFLCSWVPHRTIK